MKFLSVLTQLNPFHLLSALLVGAGLMMQWPVEAQPFRTLYSFNQETTDGVEPQGALVLSSNTLYGTASSGGTTGRGTLFRVNTDGTGYATLYNFSATSPFTNADGAFPVCALTCAENVLYGTAPSGGGAGNGVVFSINTDGTGFTVLHTFPYGPNNAEGLTEPSHMEG